MKREHGTGFVLALLASLPIIWHGQLQQNPSANLLLQPLSFLQSQR